MGLLSKTLTLPKSITASNLTLTEAPLPTRVILPLSQYIGQPATACVSVGEKVKVGQLIATPEKESSLPLHASISGTVADIREHLHHTGTRLAAVIIEADGADSRLKAQAETEQMASLEPAEILARIHEAGLIFKAAHPIPLAQELSPVDQPKTHLALTGRRVVKGTDTLLITGLDQEPSLGVNRYHAQRENDHLAPGLAALRTITGAQRTLFVVDKNHPPFPQLTEMVAADEGEATEIISLNGREFPLALPIPLIKAVLGREVALPYGHPRDVGVALYDMETTISVGASLTSQMPQVDTLISVGGGALGEKGIVRVRIGTEIGALIESLGGFIKEPAKIILGGPMTGMAHYELSAPITKEITGLFALSADEAGISKDYRQCINCGLCVKVCPVNLVPGVLSLYCARDRFDAAQREGLFSCIECGCCDYVCPSRRPMVHLFRHAKQQLMET
jgi:electron transport complex protein RnfC